MSERITVLLVDDHALVRQGFRRILEDEDCLAVVGEAGDGVRAIQMVRELRPRVVLMDCSMPGGDGLTATKEITTTYPETSVVILSMHSGDTWVRRAIEAGARGYILKNAELDLVSMIRRVVIGEIVLDQRIPEGSAMHAKRSCGLTARELQVLQLIVEGKSTIEIASLLEVSVNTVSVHRTRISRSLNCHTTAELVSFAIRNGLVNVP